MPYQSKSELPSWVKKYSEKEQEIWRRAFNNAYYQYGKSESKAFKVANAVVKNYKNK